MYNIIDIRDNVVASISIKKKRNKLTVSNADVIEKSELKKFLAGKKSLYLSIEQDNVLDEKVTIPNVIKSNKVIDSTISHKLNKIVSKQKVLFNKQELSSNKDKDTITYQIDGVYEKEYLEIFESVSDLKELRGATESRYALFAISQMCKSSDSYISIHTQADTIIFLAVDNNRLVFSRKTRVIVNKNLDRQDELVDELNKTTAYIRQQFRSVKFSHIVVSGSMAIDDSFCEHLLMVTTLPIAVLYPNTLFDGLSNEEPQHYIIALGAYFTPKQFQFIPNFVRAKKQYHLSLQTLLAISFLMFFVVAFFTYDGYSSYQSELDRYDTIKNRLVRTLNSTQTYSQDELEDSLAHMKFHQKYLKYHPIDTILELKSLVEMQRPAEFKWRCVDDVIALNVVFEKDFSLLESLQKFENSFRAKFNEINSKSLI
ncbi:MAG: hypothetical protein J7L21_03185, partial [Sulfurimonas sp.]|nr:hypothetical protein [Sulfurimonas sp.]